MTEIKSAYQVLNSRKNKEIGFKGLSVSENNSGKKSHLIYLPANNKNISLEVVELSKDAKGDYHQSGARQVLNPEKKGFLNIWAIKDQNELLKFSESSKKLGYRFLIEGQPKAYLDNVRQVQVGEDEFNLAWDPERPTLKRRRQLYHLMPDMFAKDGPDRRNHFNNFGGTIKDIQNKLDYIKELGATDILSTPVFNNGPKNSNGYWTKNPYQVDPARGSLKDFKNLQVDLYKRGMGFIADGAFVI